MHNERRSSRGRGNCGDSCSELLSSFSLNYEGRCNRCGDRSDNDTGNAPIRAHHNHGCNCCCNCCCCCCCCRCCHHHRSDTNDLVRPTELIDSLCPRLRADMRDTQEPTELRNGTGFSGSTDLSFSEKSQTIPAQSPPVSDNIQPAVRADPAKVDAADESPVNPKPDGKDTPASIEPISPEASAVPQNPPD